MYVHVCVCFFGFVMPNDKPIVKLCLFQSKLNRNVVVYLHSLASPIQGEMVRVCSVGMAKSEGPSI